MEEILECSQEKTIQVSDREWQICQLNRKVNFLAQKTMNHPSPGHRTPPTLINPVGRHEASGYHHSKTKDVKHFFLQAQVKKEFRTI